MTHHASPAGFPALAAIAAAAALAGCAAPADHFHTLRPAATASAATARQPGATLAIGPVTVPESLQREAWVIRLGDSSLQVHEHQLWAQGLAPEIAQALADDLGRAGLPEGLWPDAGPTGAGSGADLDRAPALRLRLQVLRFDSLLAPAPAVSDQFRWTIECLPADATLSPAEAGRFRAVRGGMREVSGAAPPADAALDDKQRRYDQVARGHARAVARVAEDVAAALADSAADRARDCVRPGA